MGFKRRIINNKVDIPYIGNPDLIDSPSRLLRFAEAKGIICVPLELDKLCKALLIKIVYQPLFQNPGKNEISGILSRNNEGWTIYVNKNHHINRQRFTIAHELGHYFLHRHEGNIFTDEIFFRAGYLGNEKQKMEWQANEFAASILMPRNEIEYYLNEKHITDIVELAEVFQVSTLAMRYQLERTQLLSDKIKNNYVYSDFKN